MADGILSQLRMCHVKNGLLFCDGIPLAWCHLICCTALFSMAPLCVTLCLRWPRSTSCPRTSIKLPKACKILDFCLSPNTVYTPNKSMPHWCLKLSCANHIDCWLMTMQHNEINTVEFRCITASFGLFLFGDKQASKSAKISSCVLVACEAVRPNFLY